MNLGKGGIEGSGFAASGRSGHQHHAVGFADQAAEAGQFALGETEDFEGQALEVGRDGLLVKYPDDRILAEDTRHDGDAEVDGTPADAHLESTVLGHPPLGDVELAHDLDTGDDRSLETTVEGLGGAVENAVDAIFDINAVLPGFDMDVAGALVEGVIEGRIDETNDRAGVGGEFFQGEDFFPLVRLLDQLQFEILGNLVEHMLGPLGPLQNPEDLALHRHPQDERDVEQQFETFPRRHVGGIGDGHHHPLLVATDGEETVARGHPRRQGRQQFRVGDEMLQVDIFQVKLTSQGLREGLGGKNPLGDAGAAEILSARLHAFQHQTDFRRGDGPHGDQDFADFFPFEIHHERFSR